MCLLAFTGRLFAVFAPRAREGPHADGRHHGAVPQREGLAPRLLRRLLALALARRRRGVARVRHRRHGHRSSSGAEGGATFRTFVQPRETKTVGDKPPSRASCQLHRSGKSYDEMRKGVCGTICTFTLQSDLPANWLVFWVHFCYALRSRF